jgi:hypothetical protein
MPSWVFTLTLTFSCFSFFPLPWWERIKVRGELGFSLHTLILKTPNLGFNQRFHPHPHLLPSREKEL